MKKLLTLLLTLLVGTTMALAKDVKTVVLTTNPQMHCSGCETNIKKNIRFEKGVKDIQTSVPNQTVTIKYDADKTSVEKLIKAFEKLGYTVRQLKEGEKVCADGSSSGCAM